MNRGGPVNRVGTIGKLPFSGDCGQHCVAELQSNSRNFPLLATGIWSAEPLAPSLIRVVFCCSSRDSALLHEEVWTLSAALVRTDAWVTLPSNSGGVQ
jgi:hypothetical protein